MSRRIERLHQLLALRQPVRCQAARHAEVLDTLAAEEERPVSRADVVRVLQFGVVGEIPSFFLYFRLRGRYKERVKPWSASALAGATQGTMEKPRVAQHWL